MNSKDREELIKIHDSLRLRNSILFLKIRNKIEENALRSRNTKVYFNTVEPYLVYGSVFTRSDRFFEDMKISIEIMKMKKIDQSDEQYITEVAQDLGIGVMGLETYHSFIDDYSKVTSLKISQWVKDEIIISIYTKSNKFYGTSTLMKIFKEMGFNSEVGSIIRKGTTNIIDIKIDLKSLREVKK